MDSLAFGNRVAYFEVACVWQTHNVARESLVDDALLVGHEGCGARELEFFAEADMLVGLIAFEMTRADLDESYAVAVVGVHVGMDLKDEARELWFIGHNVSLLGMAGLRLWRNFEETVEQLTDTEVVECRTEEYRGYVATAIGIDVELWVDTLYGFEFFAKGGCGGVANVFVEFGALELDIHTLLNGLFAGLVEVEALFEDVIDTTEEFAIANGPTEGTDANLELALNLIEEVEGVVGRAVHLVDEDDDGCFAHSADLHEFAGLGLYTFGCIDDNDNAIYGRKGTESIFGKVLVTRGIEDVDLVTIVLETHDGCGD